VLVLILIGAALLSALLGEFKDAIAIGAIVILFGLLGFVQEYRAEQAMAALRKLASPLVRVLRGGGLIELPAQQIVPGDVILLEAGNLVPADARLLEAVNLRIQEATLTGESEPVEKETQALPEHDLTIGDRRNMAYMGTVVTYGRGKALIVGTGSQTELGKVASLLQDVGSELTPLQKRLDQLGKLLAVVGFVVSAVIFIIGLLIGEPLRDMLLTAVSIAVAIVPEGLPAVVTITLAIGAQRMLKRKALIRKLPAVETLGSVTVICSDKTGTLTENRMTVMVLDVAGHTVNVTEEMRNRMPTLELDSAAQQTIDWTALSGQPDAIAILLVGGALCNDASLSITHDSGRIQTIGDPTEAALLISAARFNLLKDQLQATLPRVEELPFDSERKLMTTLHRFDRSKLGDLSVIFEKPVPEAPFVSFTKGAVDNLLSICSYVWLDGQARPMEGQWLTRVQNANDELARQGMRVLGVAVGARQEIPQKSELEKDLTLVGLFGMIDPPRAEVRHAVQTCQAAGIRPVMITGDHPLTAKEIARQLGIIATDPEQARALTGQELSQMDDAELQKIVSEISVYARVSPEHKLRIVQALQIEGQIVSMTGDGVNDAPALKRADIGVAMGITGTDVAKEASDMVLQDDNFSTIVSAVEEGRTIYDNLRKFVKFSVAGNIGKVSVMLLAPLLGKPLPLEPLQLLWLNLLTDGMLGLGLGLEPPEKDIMRRPPYSPKEGIFSRGLGWHVAWVGALIGLLALGIGYIYWRLDPNGPWQTMTFTTLAFSQMAQALATRSRRESFFKIGLRSNIPGMILAGVVFVLQLSVLYLPFLQGVFYTRPLAIQDLAVSLVLSSMVFWFIELEKWFIRRKEV
jgi:P-type Ca2+ transporter type 2C